MNEIEFFKRARVKFQKKDYRGAIDDYTQAIKYNSKNSILYNNRAVAKLWIGNYNGAISDFNRAIELESNNALFYRNRAKAKFKSQIKDYEGAISDLSIAIKLEPYNALYYEEIGIIYNKLDNKNLALLNWEKATIFGSEIAKKELDKYFDIKEINNIRTLELLKIKHIHHLTHKSNLPNILKYGIVSHNEAKSKKLNVIDIADEKVIKIRSQKRDTIHNIILNDFVPLYFNPRNPMLYVRRNIQNDIIIICVDPNLIFLKKSIFTDGNAASKATNFYNNKSDFGKLNREIIFTTFWNDYGFSGKRIICSETLVYPKINISFFNKIYCNNKETLQYLSKLNLSKYGIICELNNYYYF